MLEQIPRQGNHDGEIQQQQQQLMEVVAPTHEVKKEPVFEEETRPPIGKASLLFMICLIVWFSTVFQLYFGVQCTYPCFPGVLLTYYQATKF